MIELKKISKSFSGKCILKDISLTAKQGETIAVIGPSGSGKSTLLRCINFMEVPDAGTVSIDGTILNLTNAPELRKKIGMVFQHFHLFPHFNVLNNITYAPTQVLGLNKDEAEKRAYQLLNQVGLTEKANSYPNALSGGQKQRVAIARTLAMNPEAILFDEPTSALDPEMVKEVLAVIRNLAHTGITLLIVTHEMNFAKELADRILFMDAGNIIEDATPDKFFTEPQSKRAQRFLEKVL